MTLQGPIQLDFNYLLKEQLDGSLGLATSEIEALFPAALEVQSNLRDLYAIGQFPIRELPFDKEPIKRILEQAKAYRDSFKQFVVLGIGGSALGPACLNEFLNDSTPQSFFYIDNIDPKVCAQTLEQLNLAETLFIVISKSGRTVETLAAFAYFRDAFINQCGPDHLAQHFVIITDPKNGPLRQIAKQEKFTTFDIPPGIGGRYSVLSPVGLLPAACLGLDITELLNGARAMANRCAQVDLWQNPAYLLGIASYVLMTQKKLTQRVLMPYTNQLKLFTDWYRQLWAESLGKSFNLAGEQIHAGSTPICALGATDQHSQLQLYLDGPRDKWLTFYTMKASHDDIKIPGCYPDCDELKGLSSKSFGDLIDIEYRATEQALANEGIPSVTWKLLNNSAFTLGQLLYSSQIETIVAGQLLNINPFDQPAVEQIKKYIRALLEIPGHEKELEEIEHNNKSDRFII